MNTKTTITTDTSAMLTSNQAANQFYCAKSTIDGWRKNDKIKYTKEGNTYLFNREDIEKILKQSPTVNSCFNPKSDTSTAVDTTETANAIVKNDTEEISNKLTPVYKKATESVSKDSAPKSHTKRQGKKQTTNTKPCLLYTSDAADE